MRNWTLLLLGVVACGGANGTKPTAHGMTAAEKAAVEDTVRKLNAYSMEVQSRRDLKALMRLMPDTGALAITDGSMVTDMDSLQAGLEQFWGLPFLTGLKVHWDIKRIDVVSPDAAVITTSGSTVLDSAGKKQFTMRHLWTGLWQNREGRWVVVQQHASSIPEDSAK
jgi:hypothetical protein